MSNYHSPSDPLVFSSPGLSYPDDPSDHVDGPADAVRHLNGVRGIVANVRAKADADPSRYALSGDTDDVPAERETYRAQAAPPSPPVHP